MSHGAELAARAAWRSMPAMLTAHRAFVLTLLVAACGPEIDITITSGATGDAGATTTDPATTGLGGSESGPGEPCASSGDTGASSGEDSSTGSTGGASSGGEPPPVCAVFGDRCKCDGVPSNPWLCGCLMADDGCACADGLLYPDYSCGWECAPSGADPCVCGNYPAPADWCQRAPV